MWGDPEFVVEVVIGGFLSGVLYSLVALGYVLIYKASGVFNFAQGTMVLFAALTFSGCIDLHVPIWLSFIIVIAVMVGLAFGIARVALRPLGNQEHLPLLLATLRITYFLR